MLDEPMAGVNPALRQLLLDKIREPPGEGITVLFVEHDMDVVSAISDVVVCMAEGRIIASGTAGQVAPDPRVIDAYLGGSSGDLRDMADELRPRRRRATPTAGLPTAQIRRHRSLTGTDSRRSTAA